MSEPTGPEVRPDSDAAEEFAEAVGVDPTQEEIAHYQRLEGEPPAEDENVPGEAAPDPAVN